MGTYYKLNLRVGFEILSENVERVFLKSSETVIDEGDPGIFHFEERFSPKTGERVDPAKVWDVNPRPKKVQEDKWFEVDGKRIEVENQQQFIDSLAKILGCNVQYRIDITENITSYIFFLHKKGDVGNGYNFDFGLDLLDYEEVVEMKPKLEGLKVKMFALGLPVGKPKVFIAQNAS